MSPELPDKFVVLQTVIGPSPDTWANLGLLGIAIAAGYTLFKLLMASKNEQITQLTKELASERASHDETRKMLIEALRTSARAVDTLTANRGTPQT